MMKLVLVALGLTIVWTVISVWTLGVHGWLVALVPGFITWVFVLSHIPDCGEIMPDKWAGSLGWVNFKDTLGLKAPKAYCGSCVLRNGDRCKVPVVTYDNVGPIKEYPLTKHKNRRNLCIDYLEDFASRMKQLDYEMSND